MHWEHVDRRSLRLVAIINISIVGIDVVLLVDDFLAPIGTNVAIGFESLSLSSFGIDVFEHTLHSHVGAQVGSNACCGRLRSIQTELQGGEVGVAPALSYRVPVVVLTTPCRPEHWVGAVGASGGETIVYAIVSGVDILDPYIERHLVAIGKGVIALVLEVVENGFGAGAEAGDNLINITRTDDVPLADTFAAELKFALLIDSVAQVTALGNEGIKICLTTEGTLMYLGSISQNVAAGACRSAFATTRVVTGADFR